MNWSALEEIYGISLLHYIYGISDTDVDVLLGKYPDITNALGLMARGIPKEDNSGIAKYMSLSGLGRWLEEQNISLINLMRTTTGSELPELPPESGDKVLDALIILARDIWPVYLIPPPPNTPSFFWSTVTVGIYNNPHTLDLAKQILNDEKLMRLFPGAPNIDPETATMDQFLSVGSQLIGNSGGGTHQLYNIGSYILNNAYVRVLMTHHKLTWHRIKDQLTVSLKTMRDLAMGEVVDVPRLIGYSGVFIKSAKGQSIEGLKLRAPNLEYDAYFLRDVNLLNTVCETTFPLQLLNVTPWVNGLDMSKIFQKLASKIEDAQKQAQREIDLVRFAVLLASPENQFLSLAERSGYILNPITAGGTSYNRGLPPIPAVELDNTRIKQAIEWSNAIKDKNVASLDIGMRRLLQAVSDRFDVTDGFVDAIIAWENIFGTSQETVFRVTAALAKLIEPLDLDKRRLLHSELKKLYGDRSKLVHGSKEPSGNKAFDMRNRAIKIAIEALQMLYSDRSDLLPLSSEDRSGQLLLE